MKEFRPMLAATVRPEDLTGVVRYPCFVVPKLDGIRAILMPSGELLSRSLKPIRNRFIADRLGKLRLAHPLDGELLLRPDNTFQDVSSAVMSVEGTPDFTYHVFDYITDKPYHERRAAAKKAIKVINDDRVILLPHQLADNAEEVLVCQDTFLERGFEGIILRAPDAMYKFGRSTLTDQGLMKMKNFSDSEAEIIGFEQKFQNNNEKQTNALGLSERSKHKGNMKPINELGRLLVRDISTGIEFGVGSGFDGSQRVSLWKNREDLIGKLIKYKFFDIGVKDAPRHPIFIGFRDETDM